MKKHLHYDVYIGILLVLLSVVLFPMTFKFPDTAGIFPQFILVVLCLLGIYTFVYGFAEAKAERKKIEEGQEIKNIFSWEENKLPLLGYALIVVYILLIDVLGFFVSTTIFMVGYMLFLKMRKPLTLMLVPLGVDVFVYFLFVMQLKLNLPSGLLI